MPPPNLFQFATSELSQDAFICWLISWAAPEFKATHPALHATACALLDRFLELNRISKPSSYQTVEISQQFARIDVSIRLNNQIVIVVEDKTHSDQHSNQLTRYLDTVRNNFPNDQIAAIYFKTGDQSSYAAVEAAGFYPFRRHDFLAILEAGAAKGVQSDIFLNFLDRLKHMELLVSQYATLPALQWHPDCWVGFFRELQRQLGEGEWAYVPNRSGGFMGFWWHWRGSRYLQLEQDKLCFKVEVEDKLKQAIGWDEWHAAVMAEAARTGLALKRPRRRAGTWMTVAVLADDYRKFDDRGLLDMAPTLDELRKAEAMLDAAVSQPGSPPPP